VLRKSKFAAARKVSGASSEIGAVSYKVDVVG
jgi:hypothetical protein